MRISPTHVLVFFLIALAISLSGCQEDPVTPGEYLQAGDSISPDTRDTGRHQCLGYFQFIFDPDAIEIEVVPQRTSHLHLNVAGVLNTTMGVGAVGVPSLHDPANGIFVFDISLTHPFGTKPNLAGFDVKGILMTPGTSGNDTRIYAAANETRLENADAYTRWWNPTEFPQPGMFGYTTGELANASPTQLTSEINPYKYFADVLGPNDSMNLVYIEPMDSDNGRGVFRAGSSNTRRYRIRFPMDPGPQITYGYAVDASWAPPIVNPPFEVPDDFPIIANQPEAFHVALAQSANSLYYDTETGKSGGVLRLQINVHDWQGLNSGDTQAEVENILAYCPALWSGGAFFDPLDTTAYSARYTVDLSVYANPVAAGEEILAVRVASNGGPEYDQGVGPAPQEAYVATWQLQELVVTDPSCETDSNNSLAEAEEIGITGQATGELCDAVDMEDWYWFEVPSGYEVSGEVRWYSDADSCEIELYDATGDMIKDGSNMSPGLQVLELGNVFLPPGTYYLRTNAMQIGNPPPAGLVYLLETDLELTNVKPLNPVDISDGKLDCAASWLGTDPSNEIYMLMTGSAGTWGMMNNDSFAIQSRTYNGMETEPGFYFPYLYIWDWPTGGTVDLVDYSSINTPVEHDAVLTFTGDIEAMAMNSTHLHIAINEGANTYLRVYDYVTDPTAPVFAGDVLLNDGVKQLDLVDAEGDHTALVVMCNDIMTVYDVEDPQLISAVETVSSPNCVNIDISTRDNFILKTYVDLVTKGHLGIYKYDHNTGLEFWGVIDLTGVGLSVTSKGTYAYVGNENNGIDVFNYMVKNAFIHNNIIATTSPSRYIHVTDSYLFNVQDGPGVVMYDISNPALPVEMDETNCLNNPLDVTIIPPDWALFVEGVQGYGTISTVSLGGSSGPTLAHEFQLEDYSWYIDSYDDLVVVGSTDAHKIWIYEFATSPIVFNEIYSDTVSGSITALVLTNHGLYVSLLSGIMQVYDTSLAPIIIKKTDIPLNSNIPACDIEIDNSNHYAYVPHYGTTNFDVYDISTPYSWSYLTYRETVYNPRDADISNEYLYLLTTDDLQIYDIGPDPSNPSLTGLETMPYPGSMNFLDAQGQYAYVTDQGQPVQVISLYPPESPAVTGYTIPTGVGLTMGIEVYDNLLLVMKSGYGVRFFELY